jgi:predicted transcriptional regulator
VAEPEPQNVSLVGLTVDIASAYVSANRLAAGDLPGLIRAVHGALAGASAPVEDRAEALRPAVSIRKSVTDDFLICLEDGLRFKSLKRHLRTKFGLSPESYREKWGLPNSYPMVAPAYTAARSRLAKQMGLGGAKRGATKARLSGKKAR